MDSLAKAGWSAKQYLGHDSGLLLSSTVVTADRRHLKSSAKRTRFISYEKLCTIGRRRPVWFGIIANWVTHAGLKNKRTSILKLCM